MGVQRYVASDLTHFVGRGIDEEGQYNLLIKILKGGWLTHPPHDPHKQMELEFGPRPLLSSGDYEVKCVCFCDIPLADISVHMTKYSRFGISFAKETLIEK